MTGRPREPPNGEGDSDLARMPAARPALRAEYLTFGTQGVSLLLQFLVSIGIARYWGASERGDVAIAVFVAGVVATLGGMGMVDLAIVVRQDGRAKKELGPWISASVSQTVAAACVASLVVLGVTSNWLVAMGVLVLPVMTLLYRLCLAVSFANNRQAWFEVLRVIWPGSSLAAVIVLWATAPGFHPILAVIFGQVIPVGVSWVGDRTSAARLLQRSVRWPRGQHAAIARQSVVGALANSALLRLDILLVAALLSRGSAGVYAVALSGSEAVLSATTTFAMYSLRHHPEELKAHQGRARRAVMIGAALSLAGIGGFAFLSSSLLSEEFSSLPLAYALLIPGTLALIRLRMDHARSMATATARPEIVAMVGGMVLTVLLDLAMYRHGLLAFAFASSAGYCVAGASLMYHRQRVNTRRRSRDEYRTSR